MTSTNWSKDDKEYADKMIEDYFKENPDKRIDITDENRSKYYDIAAQWHDEKNARESSDEKSKDDAQPEKDQKTTVISEEPQIQEPKQPENEENADKSWKEKTLNSWKEWADKNDKDLGVYEDPEHPEFLKFKVFSKGADKEKDQYENDVIYTSPTNVSIKGKDGKVPGIEAMEATIAAAKSVNGPNISFGNIQSPEFKANLMIACLRDPEINMVNAPTAEEIATFPKELQDKIAEAQAARAKKQPENTNESKPQEKTEPELSPAQKRIAELRKQIETRNANIAEAKEAALVAGGELLDKDLKEISQEGMSAEEIKLRELRGQAKAGDKTAGHELDKRRYNTMTDEYKYVREVEMEADGKTEKKDEKGNPVYKRDKDGNFVYKTNEKGQRIKTPQYEAFLTKAGNNLSRS